MSKPRRIYSIDIFRGITIALMIIVNNPGSWAYVYAPFRHAKWHGCTLTDLVFPFFLFFWTSQKYLKSYENRKTVARSLIIGSVPVIFSCIRQLWFNSYGPFKTLYGLIVWFQVPSNRFEGSVTGLFSNPNYAGFWFSTIWPFSLGFFIQSNQRVQKYLNFLIMTITSYLLVLTGSRNALICLIFSALVLFKFKFFIAFSNSSK